MSRLSFLLLVFAALLLLPVAVSAQQFGQIRGIVNDNDFELPLGSAKVTIVDLNRSVTSTEEGNYVFNEVPPGTYTLTFSKPGYTRQVKGGVVVAPAQSTEVDAQLSGEFTDMEEFVVQDLQVETGTQEELLVLRQEIPALTSSVSAEFMSQAGAGDAAAALNLVSGATVQDGKYAVVRGLPDRYVNSQMNSVRLPSADPDKRAVQLDQFPSAVIESVRVTKTFTPDQQGDASGGAVNIILKSVPKENILKFSSSVGYNTQVRDRKDFLTYRGGGVGFLGQEAGSRPIQWENEGDVWHGAVGTTRNDAPVDHKWTFTVGGKHDFEGIRVGGLLNFFYEKDSGFFDNGIDDSYWVDDPGGPMVPQTKGNPGPGNDYQTRLFDVTKGTQEVKWGGMGSVGLETENHTLNLLYMYTRVTEDKALLAEDIRGKQYFFPGYDYTSPTAPISLGSRATTEAPHLRSQTLEYTERETQTLQLSGTHSFDLPDLQVKNVLKLLPPEVDWTLARSNSSLYQPDKRLFSSLWWAERFDFGTFTLEPAEYRPWKAGTDFLLGNLQRIWKDITEESDQQFMNFKFPFEQWTGTEGYVQFGFFNDRVHRTFNQESFSNFATDSYELNAQRYEAEWDEFWTDVFPQQDHEVSQVVDIDVDYKGSQHIQAWYWMVDLPLTSFAKVVGGFRYETTDLQIILEPGANAFWIPEGAAGPVDLNPGDADVNFTQYDVLPALAVEIEPLDGLTFRYAYTETVARQTFKELTPVNQQEFLGGDIFVGNPNLKMSAVRNWDLRMDYVPYPGGLVSVSWFRKDVTNPIETVQQSAGFTFTRPINYPEGTLEGYEFELRQKLGEFWEPLRGLTVGGNLTLIESEVQLPQSEIDIFKSPGIELDITSRHMTNAPERLYNLFLTYDFEPTGTKFGIFYTVRGDTLVAGAGTSTGRFIPSVYETEFGTLNLSLSQKIGKYIQVKFSAKNLTNPEIQSVYRSEFIDGDVLRSSHTKGIEYSFGVSATIPF